MQDLTEKVVSTEGKSALEIIMFVEEKIKKGELTAFAIKNKRAIKINSKEINTGRSFILQNNKSGENYVFRADSIGGAFSEEGDQTIYDTSNFYKVEKSFDLRRISQEIGDQYGYFPSDLAVATLSISKDTSFTAGADIDYVSGESGKGNIAGEKDAFFNDICKYIQGL